jgi:LPS export ABC transporter protein LptC
MKNFINLQLAWFFLIGGLLNINMTNSITTKKLLIIAFAITFLSFQSCKNDNIEKIQVLTASDNLPLETGTNIILNYTDSGLVKAKVFAPMLERFDNEKSNQSIMKKGITAYFYNNNKKITSYIKSKYAIRNDRLRTMTVKNDVIVVNIKGDTLRTESLVWDEKTNKINTNDNVKITTPDEIIYGEGLESNTEFSQYKIYKITGILSIKK